jgi:hypothetical protein
MSDLEFAVHEIRENNTEYTTAEDYYYGRVGEVFASPAIRKRISKSAQGFKVNFAKKPVTSRLSRLKIASVSVAPAEDNEAATAAAKELTDILVNEVWKANQMDLEAPIAHRGALVCGDAYLLVWPGDGDNGEPPVEVFFESAKTMRIFYSEEDERTPVFAAKMWTESEEFAVHDDDKSNQRCRVNLYYPDRIEMYISNPGVDPNKAESDSDFAQWIETHADDEAEEQEPIDNPTVSEELVGAQMAWYGTYQGTTYSGPGSTMPGPDASTDPDLTSNVLDQGGTAVQGDTWPVKNPFGIIPVFHLRTDRPYGRPVHADAYGPQNAITKIAATQMSATELHGFTQRYMLMEGITDDLSDTPDWDDNDAEDGNDPAPEGGLANRMEGGPGTIIPLHGVKSVGEWPASPVSNFIDPLEWWIKAMSTVTETPLQYIDPSGQLPSGVSQAEAKSPLIEDCRQLTMMFTPPWEEALEFALHILGHEDAKVQIRWAPVNSVRDLDGWQTIEAQQGAGVPVRESLIEAGYEAEVVDGWMKTLEQSNFKGRVEILQMIATALQSLGAAASLGVVDAAEVNKFAAQLLQVDIPEAPEEGSSG